MLNVATPAILTVEFNVAAELAENDANAVLPTTPKVPEQFTLVAETAANVLLPLIVSNVPDIADPVMAPNDDTPDELKVPVTFNEVADALANVTAPLNVAVVAVKVVSADVPDTDSALQTKELKVDAPATVKASEVERLEADKAAKVLLPVTLNELKVDAPLELIVFAVTVFTVTVAKVEAPLTDNELSVVFVAVKVFNVDALATFNAFNDGEPEIEEAPVMLTLFKVVKPVTIKLLFIVTAPVITARPFNKVSLPTVMPPEN